jgi:hypothetical protein
MDSGMLTDIIAVKVKLEDPSVGEEMMNKEMLNFRTFKKTK